MPNPAVTLAKAKIDLGGNARGAASTTLFVLGSIGSGVARGFPLFKILTIEPALGGFLREAWF